MKILCVLTLCSSVLLSASHASAALAWGQVYNVTTWLNLRSQPNTSSTVVAKLYNGDWVEILDYSQGDTYAHVKVTDTGKVGYCLGAYLDINWP